MSSRCARGRGRSGSDGRRVASPPRRAHAAESGHAWARHPHAGDTHKGTTTRAPHGAAEVAPDPHRAVATSPAVGVFRPGLAVGAKVSAGDRIAIVDLLGIPQDVTAPIDGTLVDVFVESGEVVEYGEEIGVIEAAPEPSPADPDATDGEG